MSMNDDIKNILVSEEALKAKVAELGAQISRDYEGRNLVLVSILKGSVVFMADLMRAVTIPAALILWSCPATAAAIPPPAVWSRSSGSGQPRPSGKDVLIVEDIPPDTRCHPSGWCRPCSRCATRIP